MHPATPERWPHSRLYALAALIALAAAVLTLAYLLISNVLFLAGAVIALVVAMVAGWTALINRGVRRAASLCVALVALAGALVLLGPAGITGMVVVVGLTIASVAAARAAIGRHRPDKVPPGVAVVGPADRPVLLLNPLSGDGTVEELGLVAEARRRGIKPVILGERDDMRGVAEREVAGGASAIGVAGGDGSQALVADVAHRNNVAFVCVPAGTYNHFAQDLGLDRRDPVAAMDAFGAAVERRIDLGIVNGRVFVNNASMGVYAAIVQADDYRATKLATTAELLPDLVGADATPFDFRFTGPQDEAFRSADLVLVSNNPYAVVTPAGLGSRPSLATGELGILAIRARGDATTPAVAHAVLNWTAPTFRVDSAATVAVGLDGEAVQLEPPLEFATMHRALRVRLPRGTIAPAAVGHALSVRRTVAALLRIVAGRPAWS